MFYHLSPFFIFILGICLFMFRDQGSLWLCLVHQITGMGWTLTPNDAWKCEKESGSLWVWKSKNSHTANIAHIMCNSVFHKLSTWRAFHCLLHLTISSLTSNFTLKEIQFNKLGRLQLYIYFLNETHWHILLMTLSIIQSLLLANVF